MPTPLPSPVPTVCTFCGRPAVTESRGIDGEIALRTCFWCATTVLPGVIADAALSTSAKRHGPDHERARYVDQMAQAAYWRKVATCGAAVE